MNVYIFVYRVIILNPTWSMQCQVTANIISTHINRPIYCTRIINISFIGRRNTNHNAIG